MSESIHSRDLISTETSSLSMAGNLHDIVKHFSRLRPDDEGAPLAQSRIDDGSIVALPDSGLARRSGDVARLFRSAMT